MIMLYIIINIIIYAYECILKLKHLNKIEITDKNY